MQKIDANDQKLLAKHDISLTSHQVLTPHPLPSYEIVTQDEVGVEQSRGQPLPTPEAVDSIISLKLQEKESENLVRVEDNTEVHKQQDDDDDSSLSEEEEAALRIQQRFSEPLVRCQTFHSENARPQCPDVETHRRSITVFSVQGEEAFTIS